MATPKIRNAYDKVAYQYYKERTIKDSSTWFYNELLEMPTTMSLLGKLKGKKILDLGCGTGEYIKRLMKKGAIVEGIDVSKKMLEIASTNCPGIRLLLGNVEHLPFRSNKFDVVICTLVMDHIASWDRLLNEVKRVLKNDGIFVFSIRNPISICSIGIIWHGRKFRIIDKYFAEGWRKSGWLLNNLSFGSITHHKTYETIVKTLLRNGFEIIDYKDAKPLPKARSKFPKEFKTTIDLPHFCSWKVRKKAA